jgi:hypothetical protein
MHQHHTTYNTQKIKVRNKGTFPKITEDKNRSRTREREKST